MERNAHIDPEWRIIAEFPQYEMSEDMQVRHSMSGKVRRPQFNKSTYYSFIKDGKTYSRSVGRLYRDTFPERDHSGFPKVGRPLGSLGVKARREAISPVRPDEELEKADTHRYHRIPDYPEYGINKLGDVMQLGTQTNVKPGSRGELSVHLKRDGQWHYIAVRKLLRNTFGR
jgi:hypothetical protein